MLFMYHEVDTIAKLDMIQLGFHSTLAADGIVSRFLVFIPSESSETLFYAYSFL